jgi:hypothetical protein
LGNAAHPLAPPGGRGRREDACFAAWKARGVVLRLGALLRTEQP